MYLKQHVSRLTSQLKNDHLPPGFETRDPQAVKLVDRFVHELVKLEKGTLHGCVSHISALPSTIWCLVTDTHI